MKIYYELSLLMILFFEIKCQITNQCIKTDNLCNCDNKCSEYGDCCIGHENYKKPQIGNVKYICKNIGYSNVWFNDNCNKYNQYYKLCKNIQFHQKVPILNIIPVFSDQNKNVYNNKYCALCDKVKKYNYLKTSIYCENFFDVFNHTYINEMMKANPLSCRSSITMFQEGMRNCQDDLIRECPKDFIENPNSFIANNCSRGSLNMIFNMGSIPYRNKDCCSCHNDTCLERFAAYSPSFFLDINKWDDMPSESLNENSTNKTTVSNFSDSKVYKIILLILQILSIIALLFLIVLYAFRPIFHNFGGYLTVCLSIHLLIFNVLLIISSYSDLSNMIYCKTIGILMHFILLSNFMWMSLYALDLIQTFGIKSYKSKTKTFKTFIIYFCCGFGAVTCWVTSAVLCDYFSNENSKWRPKYGGSHCWFTNKLGGFIWFLLPVCIFLIWNFIACGFVFYNIYKTSRESRMARKKDSNNGTTLWLCLRLTSVFGVVYLLQIIANITKVEILIIIVSFLTNLQGVFLALCFCWAKRVRNVVRSTITSFRQSISYVGSSNSNAATQSSPTNLTMDGFTKTSGN